MQKEPNDYKRYSHLASLLVGSCFYVEGVWGPFTCPCPGAHCLIIRLFFIACQSLPLPNSPSLALVGSGPVSESCGLPMWCHPVNATNTHTRRHTSWTVFSVFSLRFTVLLLYFHPPTVYDRYSRWIYSSISPLTWGRNSFSKPGTRAFGAVTALAQW